MPASAAPFFIALNAGSGHAETAERQSIIESVLRGAGRQFQLTIIDQPDSIDEIAAQLARQAAAADGVLVAAGGDGTINAVARQAIRHACAFGVLPQGTFNYFARTHGIPEDLQDAVHALLSARLATFFVGNNRLQMEQIAIPPLSAALEDGQLAAVAPRTKGKFGMLWLLLHGLLGKMGRLNQADELTTFSFRQIQVKVRTLSRRRIKVATDGEVTLMSNPLEFRVLEQQLLLLKPDSAKLA